MIWDLASEGHAKVSARTYHFLPAGVQFLTGAKRCERQLLDPRFSRISHGGPVLSCGLGAASEGSA